MLSRNPYRGKYVVFEGIDGSGKDTQISLLEPELLRKNIPYVRSSEPTTFLPTGLLIKALLRGKYNFDPRSTVLLFLVDSHEHLRLRVIPNLRRGRWVLSSRSFLSTLAYHTVLGIEREFIENILDRLDFILPDAVILLDVPAEEALSRKGKELVKQVYEDAEFLENVRRAYLDLAKEFDNVHVIDGRKDPFEIAKEVKEIILG
ncbi:MAG: dTMP kinase [Candidatus Diapherotrites archaeon]|nr:dTMP kinase [Candidatus Diapherotrites archaeon]